MRYGVGSDSVRKSQRQPFRTGTRTRARLLGAKAIVFRCDVGRVSFDHGHTASKRASGMYDRAIAVDATGSSFPPDGRELQDCRVHREASSWLVSGQLGTLGIPYSPSGRLPKTDARD